MRRIGILGGTFDPIHNGHLIIAEQARDLFELDLVVFIPCGTPHHKEDIEVSNANDRFNMVKLAIEGNSNFDVSDIEINRLGNTYTIDTLRELKSNKYKDDKLFYIIGEDVFTNISTWKDYTNIFPLCQLLGFKRFGVDERNVNRWISYLKTSHSADIQKINSFIIDISSTIIRTNVMRCGSIKYLVPQKVEEYIIQHQLYC